MVQPMRPDRSARTRFCPGTPAPLAASKASSSVRTRSSGVSDAPSRSGGVPHPARRAQAAHEVRPDHRSPDRPAHGEALGVLTGHGDLFLVLREALPALGRLIAVRIGWVQVQQDQVGPVRVGVGEAPGQIGVAARDERGDARQRGADQRVRLRRVASGHSRRARYHVLGTRIARCMSFATSAAPSRVSRPPTAQLLLPSATSSSLDAPRRLVLEPRRRPSARAARSPACPFASAAGCRPPPRDRGLSNGSPTTGASHSVPGRRHQVEHLGRQHFAHRRQAGLVVAVLVLQREEHRQHHEQAVLGAPGGGGLAQQRVLEGRRRQRRSGRRSRRATYASSTPWSSCDKSATAVRASDAGGEGAPADPREAPAAHQRRQLSGGAPARQIHLEEAVLCVKEARGAGHVLPRAAPNRRNAQPVPLDDDGRRQPRQSQLAVQRGQARDRRPYRPPAGARQSEHQKCARPRR